MSRSRKEGKSKKGRKMMKGGGINIKINSTTDGELNEGFLSNTVKIDGVDFNCKVNKNDKKITIKPHNIGTTPALPNKLEVGTEYSYTESGKAETDKEDDKKIEVDKAAALSAATAATAAANTAATTADNTDTPAVTTNSSGGGKRTSKKSTKKSKKSKKSKSQKKSKK